MKKLLIGLALLALVVASLIGWRYSAFTSETLGALASNSAIADTALGQIEYQYLGDEGPVVLFLHGTPGGYDQGLDTPGYRALSPSRPGYLRTPLSVGATPAEQAQAFAHLLDHLSIDSAYVMGASGGGPSAIEFAIQFPERTKALVLIEAVSETQTSDDSGVPAFMNGNFTSWFVLSAMGWIMGPEGLVELLIPDPANQALVLEDETKLDAVSGLMWSLWPPSQRQAGMNNDLEQFTRMSLDIERITAPVLLVHGTADASVPFSESEHFKARLPHAELYRIEGADHMMPFTHQQELEQAIDRFVSSLQAPSAEAVLR